jgi:serine/threonine protein kinase
MDPIRAPLPPRYEMLGELGRGGMGIVHKVRDRETGEVLGIKLLKPEIAANTQILDRFKNELLLAHKNTHRNVARLYEFHRLGVSGTVYTTSKLRRVDGPGRPLLPTPPQRAQSDQRAAQ